MKSKIVALSRSQDFKDLINKKKITNKYVTIFFGKLKNKNYANIKEVLFQDLKKIK